MHNNKYKDNVSDSIYYSKYYCLVIQYTTRMNSTRLNKVLRELAKVSARKLNLRLVPADINAEISGYLHNGVTPLGIKTKMPIIISDKLLNFIPKSRNGTNENNNIDDYMWLGAGEVNLKWRISLTQFINHFKPFILDICDY